MSLSQQEFDALVAEGKINPEKDVTSVDDVSNGAPEPESEAARAAQEAEAGQEGQEASEEDKEDAKALKEKLAALEADLQAQKVANHALAAQMNAAPAPTPTAPPTPQPAPRITADDLVEGDGAGFQAKFDQLLDRKVQPLVKQFTQNQAATLEQLALQRSEILSEYPQTVAQIKSTLNPAALANPQSWNVIEAMVAKTHQEEIIQKRIAAAAAKPSPPVTAGVTASPETQGLPSAQLTPEEKATAKLLGVSPEAYLASKTAMGMV